MKNVDLSLHLKKHLYSENTTILYSKLIRKKRYSALCLKHHFSLPSSLLPPPSSTLIKLLIAKTALSSDSYYSSTSRDRKIDLSRVQHDLVWLVAALRNKLYGEIYDTNCIRKLKIGKVTIFSEWLCRIALRPLIVTLIPISDIYWFLDWQISLYIKRFHITYIYSKLSFKYCIKTQ